MRRVLAAGILLSLLTAPAFAEKRVTVTGCVAQGVEFGCLALRTITGKTYNISAAQPRPTPGTYGTVTGTLQPGGASFCSGEIIDPATWKMRGKFCPKAKRAK
jgi:hypothetical protein